MGKNLSLEGLRGVACLNVFAAHFLFPFFPYLGHALSPVRIGLPPSYNFERWLSLPMFTVMFNGNFAVCIFFVLSGHVLVRRFVETGDKRILVSGALKRYPRLALPSLASVLFAYLLLSAGAMQTASLGSAQLAGWLSVIYDQQVHLFKAIYDGMIGAPLFGGASDITLNGPLWTLRIELWSSIGLFALYYVFGRKNFALALLIFAAFCFCSRTPLYFLPFALGAMIVHLEKRLVRYPHAAALMLAGGMFFGAYEYSPTFLWLPGSGIHNVTIDHIAYFFDPRTLYNDIGGMLVVAGVIGCAPVASLLASKPLAYLGKISFGIYLLHWPIFFSLSIWLVIVIGNQGISHLLAVSISFIVTLAVVLFAAAAFHRWIDLPSYRLADWIARTANSAKRSDPTGSAA